MCKKLIIAILGLLLIISAGSTYAASDKTEVGGSCTKEKSTANVDSGKFICTKFQGRLTWQPSTKEIQLRIWRDLQTLRSNNPDVNTALDIRVSPTANKEIANYLIYGFNQAAKLWQYEYLPEQPLPVLLFTEKDRAWFIDTMKAVGVYNKVKVDQFDDEVKRNSNRANWAGVSSEAGKRWMTFMIGTSKKKPDLNDSEVSAHEYTHLVQFALASNSQSELACWQIEGGAFFYGMYLGAKNEKSLKEIVFARNTERYFLGFDGLVKQSAKKLEPFLNKFGPNYDNSRCGPDGAYPVGSAAMEYLYTLKGHAGTINLLTNIASQGNFAKGIEVTFGQDWPSLRKAMANYIALVIAQNNY